MATNHQKQEHLNVEEALSKSEAFVEKNKKSILMAIAVIAAIIVGVVLYHNYYKKPREHKAQVALAKGQAYFDAGDVKTALNGDSVSYAGFVKVSEDFSGTKAGNIAKAYAGLSYAKLGNDEEAVKWLDKFDASDKMVAPSILAAAGNCYANLGQLDKATANLTKAAEMADNNTLSPLFLMQAAEIYVKQQKYDEALKAYNKVKENYRQSMQALDIDKYIERVELLKK